MRVTWENLTVEMRGVSPSVEKDARDILERQLTLSQDPAVSPPLADDLAFFLRARYLELGYAAAEVDWTLEGNLAVLLVNEGLKRTIGDVTVEGESQVPEDELKAYLLRQTREREGRLAKTLPYVAADIEAGVGLVARKLQAEGYLNAAVEGPVLAPRVDSGVMDISLTLRPGPRFTYGRVTVEGAVPKLEAAARKRAAGLEGSPYSEVALENVRQQIKGDHQARGWFKAEVTAVAAPPGAGAGASPASLKVTPGELFTVSGVTVAAGLSRGAERLVTSVFNVAQGERYAPDSLDLLHRRALDTGVFTKLDVVPEADGPDTLALQVTVEEAKPKTLGLYGGYETFKGPILGTEARHVNFWDTGDSVALRAEGSARGLDGSLQLVDPAIFSTRNSLSLDLSAQTFSFKDYERNTLAARATLTRRFTRRVSAGLFTEYSMNETESRVLTREELGPDSYRPASAGGNFTLDFRDSPLIPRRGWLVNGALQGFSGAGDVSFLKSDLSAAFYYPFSAKWRAAAGARTTTLSGVDDPAEVPIDLRVYNGGGNSVRSFPERELGPVSRTGTPLGGLSATVVSAELSYEVISGLEIAAFGDAGTLDTEGSSVFAVPDDWRYAIGAGLRYKLPIGPLRVDYGFNPDRREGEPFGALHVTFGFAF